MRTGAKEFDSITASGTAFSHQMANLKVQRYPCRKSEP
jgi:hypothetical protein